MHSTNNIQQNETVPRLLKLDEVMNMTGLSKSSVYHQMNKGTFPRPINIGVKSVAWLETDIQLWIKNKIELRNSASYPYHRHKTDIK